MDQWRLLTLSLQLLSACYKKTVKENFYNEAYGLLPVNLFFGYYLYKLFFGD